MAVVQTKCNLLCIRLDCMFWNKRKRIFRRGDIVIQYRIVWKRVLLSRQDIHHRLRHIVSKAFKRFLNSLVSLPNRTWLTYNGQRNIKFQLGSVSKVQCSRQMNERFSRRSRHHVCQFLLNNKRMPFTRCYIGEPYVVVIARQRSFWRSW